MSNSGTMNPDSSSDIWGSGSTVYGSVTTYVTRSVAEQLISWVNSESPFSTSGVTAFDNGCGTGVVTAILSSRYPLIPILAADLSPGMLEVVQKQEFPRVRTQVLNALDLRPVQNDTFTHSISTFMVQFTPDPLQALREMFRVTKVGGTVGLGHWSTLCFDFPWVDACRHFEPDYSYPHTWTPDWADEEKVMAYLTLVGFKHVQMKTIRPRWNFGSAEAYMEFFLGSKNPEFVRAHGPWRDSGKFDDVKPIYERLVREEYNWRDPEMKVFMIVAKK